MWKRDSHLKKSVDRTSETVQVASQSPAELFKPNEAIRFDLVLPLFLGIDSGYKDPLRSGAILPMMLSLFLNPSDIRADIRRSQILFRFFWDILDGFCRFLLTGIL